MHDVPKFVRKDSISSSVVVSRKKALPRETRSTIHPGVQDLMTVEEAMPSDAEVTVAWTSEAVLRDRFLLNSSHIGCTESSALA